jgi:predicted small metal-binding protein
MKRYTCGDIVPGCDETFTAADDDGVFALAAPHAAAAHGITGDMLTPELMARFRAAIVTVR